MAYPVTSYSTASATPSSANASANALGLPSQEAHQSEAAGKSSRWFDLLSGFFGNGSGVVSSSQSSSWLEKLGSFLFPPAEPAVPTPAVSAASALRTSGRDAVKNVAYAITGAFEGGRPQSLQTLDDGIISYGIHQATLKSGALGAIIHKYTETSTSEVASALKHFLPRVDEKDAGLANSPYFLLLLKQAAKSTEMVNAQNEVFGINYWKPAIERTKMYKLSSPLAASLFYDTAVHGGIVPILNRVSADFAGKTPTEAEFLREFLVQRKEFLLTTAELKRKAKKEKQAEMLENAAVTRIDFFKQLLDAENFELKGTFNILGHTITGLPSNR